MNKRNHLSPLELIRAQPVLLLAIAISIIFGLADAGKRFLAFQANRKQQQHRAVATQRIEMEKAKADLAYEEQKRAHENQKRAAKLKAEQFEDEARQLKQAEARIKAAREKRHADRTREEILADYAKFHSEREKLQQRIEELLTNEEGRRISNDPTLIGLFVQAQENNQAALDELAAIKRRIPEPYVPPKDDPYYMPRRYHSAIYEQDRRLESLAPAGDEEAILRTLARRTQNYEPREPLHEAIATWREKPEEEQTVSSDTAEDIAVDKVFCGRYQFVSQASQPTGFFKLNILARNGIYFRGFLQLAEKVCPITGELGSTTITFNAYQDKAELQKPDAVPYGTFTGEHSKVTLTGTFELPATEAAGTFFSQAQDAEPDPYAPGAIWTGQYTRRQPRPTYEQTKFSMKILSRSGNRFTAVAQPDNLRLFNGEIHREYSDRVTSLTWSSKAGKEAQYEYTATNYGSGVRAFFRGRAVAKVKHVNYVTDFTFQFDKIEDSWGNPEASSAPETAQSNETAAYQSM